MIFEPPQALKNRIGEVARAAPPGIIHIFEDTSEFMSIGTGDVLRLGGNDYWVTGQAREGRFGVDEQPKYWVKKAVDLTTCERKIVKMVFHEAFDCRIGTAVYRCKRSPEKEAEILLAMRSHPNFMHGRSVRDSAGNLVRVIDFISGPSLYDYLRQLKMPHAVYYRQHLSDVMQRVMEAVEAIARLHELGRHHGDIRADHIILESNTGAYVWIDFDYEISDGRYDLFCLGNVILQAVGKGRHSLEDVHQRPFDYPDRQDDLTAGDMSLMFRHRIANLRKLFPCISEALNEILMRFSSRAPDPYKSVDSLLQDLRFLFPAQRGPGI